MNPLTSDPVPLANLRKGHAFGAEATNLLIPGSALCRTRTQGTPLPAGQFSKEVGPTRGQKARVLALALRGTPRSKRHHLSVKILTVTRRNTSGPLPVNVLTEGRIVVVPPGVETSGDFRVFTHVTFPEESAV